MNKQTKKYQSFRQPFYKLLGISLLSFGLLYSGIVWAAFNISGAQHCFDNPSLCVGLAPAGNDVSSSATSGTLQSGAGLKVTNNGTAPLFVPLKTKEERDGLLSVKQTNTNQYLNNIDVCQPSLSSSINSVFGFGVVGCVSGPVINGACGASIASCDAGTRESWRADSNFYRWSCVGSNGGTDDLTCNHRDTNCQHYFGTESSTQQGTNSSNGCKHSATYSDRSDISSYFLWRCTGNGFTDTCYGAKDENAPTACTNKPSNSSYDSGNETTPNCNWSCNSGWSQSGSSCVADVVATNGSCGYYDGRTQSSMPSSSSLLCSTGQTSAIANLIRNAKKRLK